eukprot:1180785-Prorocentrum_minimum.AAC.3
MKPEDVMSKRNDLGCRLPRGGRRSTLEALHSDSGPVTREFRIRIAFLGVVAASDPPVFLNPGSYSFVYALTIAVVSSTSIPEALLIGSVVAQNNQSLEKAKEESHVPV